jgi:ssDNA-binding Zn-finger/Zn-ribbon topoisomerase 1
MARGPARARVAGGSRVKPEPVICPDCGAPMVSRVAKPKPGDLDQSARRFWGCSRYPRCRGTRDTMGRSRQERKAAQTENPDPGAQSRFSFDRDRWDP